MITRSDLLAYVLYAGAVLICVVKIGLLVRIRRAMRGLPAAQRGLVTILTDNNLVWCLTMALTATVIVLRVLGAGSPVVGRFAILGVLVGGSALGLVRLGNWFLYDDGGRHAIPPDDHLSVTEEVVRIRISLDRLARALAERERADTLEHQRPARGID